MEKEWDLIKPKDDDDDDDEEEEEWMNKTSLAFLVSGIVKCLRYYNKVI